jgi:hypothetical protein
VFSNLGLRWPHKIINYLLDSTLFFGNCLNIIGGGIDSIACENMTLFLTVACRRPHRWESQLSLLLKGSLFQGLMVGNAWGRSRRAIYSLGCGGAAACSIERAERMLIDDLLVGNSISRGRLLRFLISFLIIGVT